MKPLLEEDHIVSIINNKTERLQRPLTITAPPIKTLDSSLRWELKLALSAQPARCIIHKMQAAMSSYCTVSEIL